MMSRKSIVIVVSIGIAIACLMSYFYSDLIKVKYENWDNLPPVGTAAASWIPDFLYTENAFRNNVFQIIEIHNLDTNYGWGKFSYDTPIDFFLNGLEVISSADFSEINRLRKKLQELGLRQMGMRPEAWRYVPIDEHWQWLIHDDKENKTTYYCRVHQR